jgi:hypothetical protein
LWSAFFHPWLFVALFVGFVLFVAWLLPRVWGALRRLFAKLASRG